MAAPASRPEAPPAKPAEFDFRAVLALQQFDGSWADASALSKAGNVTAKAWAGVLEQANGASIFATSLAIAILRTKASERQASWALIERKALEWLSAHGVSEVEELIERAIASL
jgi:hypothetical protein